jgi:transcriptional regulator with XRE-family HTH domain
VSFLRHGFVVASPRQSVVAKRLREARLAAGLSQRELGVRAGMDPSVASPRINQYERAKHLPDPQTLERLGTVLDRPLPFFYATDEDLAFLITVFHQAKATQRRAWLAEARRRFNPDKG